MSEHSSTSTLFRRRSKRHDRWLLFATAIGFAVLKFSEIGRSWPTGAVSSWFAAIGAGLVWGVWFRLALAIPAWWVSRRWGARSRLVLGGARPVKAWSYVLDLALVAAAPIGVFAIASATLTTERFTQLELPLAILAFTLEVAVLVHRSRARKHTILSWQPRGRGEPSHG